MPPSDPPFTREEALAFPPPRPMPRHRLLAVLLLLASLALAAGTLRVAWEDHALIVYLESR